MAHTTVAFSAAGKEYPLQIWHDDDPSFRHTLFSRVSYVNYRQIPLFLISSGPFNVFSDNSTTEAYFRDHLAAASLQNPSIGILSKSKDDLYLVLYIDQAQKAVRCFAIDFGALEQLEYLRSDSLTKPDVCVYYDKGFKKSDTTIFDRVLENKQTKRNQYVAPRAPEPTQLSVLVLSGDQITQAVTKVTLSGLRLRGLAPGTVESKNDKIAIRELFLMTKKSALFALRKYNYGFNGTPKTVRLSDVQDVVERLLQAYVDVEL